MLALTSVVALAAVGIWYSAQPAGVSSAVRPSPAPSGAVLAAGAQPSIAVPPGRAEIRVPILEYHYIRVNPDPSDRLGYNLSVTPDDFAAQMDWLAANDYHPVTIADLRDYFKLSTPLPSRPVVLTFDDGYADFYSTAFPVLRAHHFKSVAFIVSGFLNRRVYMNPDQIAALDRTGLVEIGSHTVSHVNLATAAPADLALQVGQSKSTLEALLGHPVLDFCYPSGAFNSTVEEALAAAGYQTATTELPGTEHSWADALTWSRVRVGGGEKLTDFIAGLGSPEPAVPAAQLPMPARSAGMVG
ncbi:MAG TPA: polysaccharide deacetylase family protein [Candidatus Dormibacteraeota bacterium]|nr:polysaccharide deacetylase family protein [Candidatus Dormibacteraeota bacterium]